MQPNLILLSIKGADWVSERTIDAIDRHCQLNNRKITFNADGKTRISLNEDFVNLKQIENRFVKKHFLPIQVDRKYRYKFVY